jgi:hypothetical protein
MAGAEGRDVQMTRRRIQVPFALWIILALALVGAVSLWALRTVAQASPRDRVGPTPVLSASSRRMTVDRRTAAAALLTFVPAGDADNLGTAMCRATGQTTCPVPRGFPGTVTVRPGPRGRWAVTVTLTVNVPELLQRGEIVTGSVPGASDLRTGQLAVSTNDAVYGVTMNPKTHRAVFSYLLAPDASAVWALNWNALGAVSQSTSLQ